MTPSPERVGKTSGAEGEPDPTPIRVDKGIAIPARDYGRRGGVHPRYPWREMEIGDSFFVPDPATQDFISGARHYAQRALGFKFITRVVEGGIRVWRVEKPADPTPSITPESKNG